MKAKEGEWFELLQYLAHTLALWWTPDSTISGSFRQFLSNHTDTLLSLSHSVCVSLTFYNISCWNLPHHGISPGAFENRKLKMIQACTKRWLYLCVWVSVWASDWVNVNEWVCHWKKGNEWKPLVNQACNKNTQLIPGHKTSYRQDLPEHVSMGLYQCHTADDEVVLLPSRVDLQQGVVMFFLLHCQIISSDCSKGRLIYKVWDVRTREFSIRSLEQHLGLLERHQTSPSISYLIRLDSQF